MDRRELEIMLNDAFDRGIVTARAVEGIYPPAVTVGILDDLGREIDFGHEGSGLTVFLPGIEDDARFAGSCKALGGKVPQNTYRMELVSAIAGELMGAESATALSALESALDRARRRGYCDEMDLLYDPAVESETKAALFDRFIAYSSWHHTGAYARETEFFALDEAAVVGAFRELGPEEAAERDRIRAQAAARVREAERHRREAECLFEYRFSCSPYSAMAYEAFHPELCERRVSKRRKQELVVYRLPDGSEPSGYAEMSVPADYADSSHVVPSVFISGTGGDRAWRDIDFDEAERKFAAAARRAAAFREGRPKLMQDEARRAAIRETRHRVCTAPILKSIKEIHR